MQVVIIGAGRGSRLMPTTADTPKCFAEVDGKRLLDWALEAFRANGIDRFTFIGGYRIESVQADYPEFEFRHNVDWPNNNILASLFFAEDVMVRGPFICCYSDILFNANVVRRLVESPEDITLAVDTHWLTRYDGRTQHPTTDAEKVTAAHGSITRVHREIDASEAYGEYTGVAKFSSTGAAALREHYHRCRERFAGKPWRDAKVFEKAYKILLFQEMLERGVPIAHVDTPGGYIEVDTQQDFDYARRHWASRHAHR